MLYQLHPVGYKYESFCDPSQYQLAAKGYVKETLVELFDTKNAKLDEKKITSEDSRRILEDEKIRADDYHKTTEPRTVPEVNTWEEFTMNDHFVSSEF